MHDNACVGLEKPDITIIMFHIFFPTIQNLTNFGEVFGCNLVVISSTEQNKKLDLSSYSVKKKVEITKVDKNAYLITLK